MSLMRNFGTGSAATEPNKEQVIKQATDTFNDLIKKRALKDMELEQKAFCDMLSLKYSKYIQEVTIKK